MYRAYDIIMHAIILGIFTVAFSMVMTIAWISYGQI